VAIEAQSDHLEIEWRPLAQQPFAVAVPINHPLASQPNISPVQISQQRLLTLDPDQYPDYWKLVSAYLTSQNLPQQIYGEFDGIDSLLTGVASGLGICFISQDAKPNHAVKILPLSTEEKPSIPVAIGTARDKIIEPVVAHFIQFVVEACLEIEHPPQS